MSLDKLKKGDSNSSWGIFKSDEASLPNEDPQQFKYKKAVREISKLINLVKSLKNNISDLEVQLNEALSKNQDLECQIKEMKSAENTNKMEIHLSQNNALEKELENTGSISEYLDIKKRAYQLEEAINDKQRVIRELQTMLDNKHIQNADLNDKCNKLSEEVEGLKIEADKQRYLQDQLAQKEMLQNELKKSQKYIGFLTQECNRVKQEHFLDKNITAFQNINSQQFSNMFLPSRRISQQKGNYQSLQAMRNQYKHKREKYKKQIKQLKQTVQQYMNKYEKMTEFVEKQQKFIEKTVLSHSSFPNNNHFNNFSAFTQNQSDNDPYRI